MRIGEAMGGGGTPQGARTAVFEKALAHARCEDGRGGPGATSATGPGGAVGARAEAGASLQVEGPCAAAQPAVSGALSAIERVADAQQRLDSVLRMASAGKGLSAGALLALQADVYRSSQLLELAGKVVERATSGVKQVLTTQL